MALQRKLVCLLVAAGITLVAVGPAQAKIQIGVSEQSPTMFANKYFKPLGFRYGRIVVPWNILQRHDYWPGYLQAWLAGAQANNVHPMVAFNIIDIKAKYYGKGPTLGQYTKLIKGFRKKYPTVKTLTPWNEENHKFHPTFRKQKLAYQYYKIAKKYCKGCKVLAADVLDQTNITSWLRK